MPLFYTAALQQSASSGKAGKKKEEKLVK